MADKWTPAHIQDALDLEWPLFQKKYGADWTSFDGYRKKRYNALNGRLPMRQAQDLIVPEPLDRQFEDPIRLPHANALIIGDLHSPYHNDLMLRRAFWLRRRRHKVDTAIIIGDLFNFESISRHGLTGPFVSLEQESIAVRKVLRSFMQHFQTIYVTLGNHDRRLAKRMDHPMSFQFIIDGALGPERGRSQIIATDHDYIYLDHPAGDDRSWIVGHPSSYSGQGGKTPSEIALVEHRNAICGHNHIVGTSQSRCGRYLGIDTGHCTNPDLHHYLTTSMTRYTRWNAGFCYLEDGYPHAYTEKWSDWAKLGCE